MPENTCLFTGAVLGPDEKVEHTIPRALGGRIRSRAVSSSAFNELCGRTVDPYLARRYGEIMRALGPLLPSESRSASEEFLIEGTEGRWQFDEFNRLAIRNPVVTDRDPQTGRPLSAIGPDVDSLRRMIRELDPAAYRARMTLPRMRNVPTVRRPTIHWAIEVAALKAILLTFDELLRDDPRRFTRSPVLDPVREFVRSTVESETDEPNIDPLAEYSLGLQYEAEYRELYSRLMSRAGLPNTPFQHTLIVSAKPLTGTLDAMLWLFETDPHTFRLARDWDADEFTYVAINGILIDQGASQAVRLEDGFLLGGYTHRRCRIRVESERNILTTSDTGRINFSLHDRFVDLYRRAVVHTERHSVQAVMDSLNLFARLDPLNDHRLSTAVYHHLVGLFHLGIRGELMQNRFVESLIPIIDDAAPDRIPRDAPHDFVPDRGWDYWIQLYRECLEILISEFGLPALIEVGGNVWVDR